MRSEQANVMDGTALFDEVLQLTMRRHADDVTEEELARLEQQLATSDLAVIYYLKLLEDGLTVREFFDAKSKLPVEATSFAPLPCGKDGAQAMRKTNRHLTQWLAVGIACTFLAIAATFWVFRVPASDVSEVQSACVARVVNVSNVEWLDLEHRFTSWSHVVAGDVLRFRSGILNVYIDNGVDLLIEGPADLEFVSLERVAVSEGRLAVRVGPDAIGFRIETPHANVIDRGTAFGISVDASRQTDVVVYEGVVDLDVVCPKTLPRRRMGVGEALRVDNNGDLSRIASVQGCAFPSPPQIRTVGGAVKPIILSVTDNIHLDETAKCNRLVPGGFGEDCRAYVDREHEWNGVTEAGLPDFLVGGDYVMTFNEDKTDTRFELTVELALPADLYVLFDNRVPPPAWLVDEFVDTGVDIGLDEVHRHANIENGVGSGKSLDQFFSVWKRQVAEPSSVLLGPLGHEQYTQPARVVKRGMYGIVATPIAEKSM